MALLTDPSGLFWNNGDDKWYMCAYKIDGTPVAAVRWTIPTSSTRWTGWVEHAWICENGKFEVNIGVDHNDWHWQEASYCWCGLARPYTYLSQQSMIANGDPKIYPTFDWLLVDAIQHFYTHVMGTTTETNTTIEPTEQLSIEDCNIDDYAIIDTDDYVWPDNQ